MEVSTRILTIDLIIYSFFYILIPSLILGKNQSVIKLILTSPLLILVDLFISAWSLDSFHSPFFASVVSITLLYGSFKRTVSYRLNLFNFLLINDILARLISLLALIIPLKLFHLDALHTYLISWSLETILVILFYLLLRKTRKQLLEVKDSCFASRTMSTLLISLIILFSFISYLFSNESINYSLLLLVLLLFMSFQFFSGASITYIYSQKKIIEQEKQAKAVRAEDLAIYLDRLDKNYLTIRKIRHDLNDLLALSQLMVKDGNLEHVSTYLDNLAAYIQEEMPQDSHFNFVNLKQIEVMDLRYLLMAKLMEWEKEGISYQFECLRPIQDLPIATLDFLRCLSILINNANEAVTIDKSLKTKPITLLLVKSDWGLCLKVTNPSSAVNIEEAKQIGHSTKAGHNGLGLANLKDIVDKYPNAWLNLSYIDQQFCAELYIRNP
ncbi:GHKL domain-containing protein [Aerococcus sanguinicola]|uniref:GHKL domain-containing protein n=3 Tax=Aerococcaceae TaxID=186827 RepID=A0A5N1GJN5_9LACT|nr:GHKL domain-containing protein [Aerococcus sanguinicola]